MQRREAGRGGRWKREGDQIRRAKEGEGRGGRRRETGRERASEADGGSREHVLEDNLRGKHEH